MEMRVLIFDFVGNRMIILFGRDKIVENEYKDVNKSNWLVDRKVEKCSYILFSY